MKIFVPSDWKPRPAALPLAVAAGLGLAQTFKMCMAKPACVEAIMGISIGAAAWLGFKVTADKLKDESYESIKSDDSNDQNKKNIKQQPGSAAATSAPDPDDDDNDFDPDEDTERKTNPEKSESKIWKELKPYRKDIKTNDLSGKKQRFYQWDKLHNEIEMYDSRGNPIDAIDPKTGARLLKDVSKHKPLKL